MTIGSWSNTSVKVTVPAIGTGRLSAGPYQLSVTADNGKQTVNGLTFHVLGGSGAHDPPRLRGGPGDHCPGGTAPYDAVQPRLDG